MYPVLQQVQWYTGSKSEFDIKAEFLESEEVLADVFSKVTSYKLFAAIIESTSAVSASILDCWPQKLGIV